MNRDLPPITIIPPDSAAGMTLEEYFIGQALVGLLASGSAESNTPSKMAEFSRLISRAVMKELGKPCT